MSRALALLLPVTLAVAVACGDGDGAILDVTPQPTVTAQVDPGPSATPLDITGEIGPEAVWDLGDGALTDLLACEAEDLACATAVMRDGGATEEAVAFFEETGWLMSDFLEFGTVDVVALFTPWRANSNDDWALVNGDPPFVLVEEVGASFVLDESDEAYQALVAEYEGLTIWPTDANFEFVTALGGSEISTPGRSFLFDFPLNDGCHACGTPYIFRVAFNFSADGLYLGANPIFICNPGPGTIESVRFCP